MVKNLRSQSPKQAFNPLPKMHNSRIFIVGATTVLIILTRHCDNEKWKYISITFAIPVSSKNLTHTLDTVRHWSLQVEIQFDNKREWANVGAVGWGTMLQAISSQVQFPMRSLGLFIDFKPLYGPGVNSTSKGNEYQEYLLGGKGGQCIGLTMLPPWYANCPEILGASTFWSLEGL